MNKPLTLLLCLLALGGCQTLPDSNTAPDTAAETSTPVESITPPVRNFDSETLYDLLLAELAGQRQQPHLALQRYQQQLQHTQSPLVAERTFRIAEYLDERPLALHSALTWVRLAPDNAEAHRAAALELAKSGRFEQALEHTSHAVRLEPDNESHFDFIAFAAGHADPSARPALLQAIDRLLLQHPQRNELWLGKALLLQSDDPQQALQLLKQMPADANIQSLALQARLLQQLDQPEQSLQVQARILDLQPDNSRLRLALARQLISMNRLEEARDLFIELLQTEPDNDDFRLGLAYLYMDLEAWQEALVYLEELLQRGSHVDAALYNKGRSLEALEQTDAATGVYRSIVPGNYFLAAQQQLGLLQLQQGNLKEFHDTFAHARRADPEEETALLQIEIEVLGRQQHNDLAWQRAGMALQHFPDDHNLLYTRAMLAEKRNDLQQLETDLRRILANEPDNAMALNALGYTLTDRTGRHAEALQLIQRAHELQPDDAATLDSLGWVHYRLGQPEQALPLLERAFAAYPDAEVAAHLGEVHWALGNKRTARKIWQEALRKEPGHSILLETVKRLDPGKRWLK